MKKVRRSRKGGFTLLEVMLATVIMVIASTMIMKGFIAVMIMARNNNRYTKSGEENYRRAINETIIHNATSRVQQNVIDELGANGYATELTAQYPNTAYSNGIDPKYLNLTVDAALYTDPAASVGTSLSSDAVQTSTLANNRYAFFYDFGAFIEADANVGLSGADRHIIRWGYTKEGSAGSYTYHYGYYCFNAAHVNEDGSYPSCRTTSFITDICMPAAPENTDTPTPT